MHIDWEHFSFRPRSNALTLTGHRMLASAVAGSKLTTTGFVVNISSFEAVETITTWYQMAIYFLESQQWDNDALGARLWPVSLWTGLLGKLIFDEDFVLERVATSSDIKKVKEFVRGGRCMLVWLVVFATACYRTDVHYKDRVSGVRCQPCGCWC